MLYIEQFTSIIKTTKHGIQRLIERKFTPEEVKALIKSPDILKTQSDGAQVFVKLVSDNKYNLMIYNQIKEEVVTALKNLNKNDIIKLGKNYGYEFD